MTTHTTSTKCQYRPTISRPMKFPGLKRPLLVRGRQAREPDHAHEDVGAVESGEGQEALPEDALVRVSPSWASLVNS